jgi:hypothetical protein
MQRRRSNRLHKPVCGPEYGVWSTETVHTTCLNSLPITEQNSKIRAIRKKIVTKIIDLREHILNSWYLVTNPNLTTQSFLQIGGSTKVISVHMGFQNLINNQFLISRVGDDLVSRFSIGTT